MRSLHCVSLLLSALVFAGCQPALSPPPGPVIPVGEAFRPKEEGRLEVRFRDNACLYTITSNHPEEGQDTLRVLASQKSAAQRKLHIMARGIRVHAIIEPDGAIPGVQPAIPNSVLIKPGHTRHFTIRERKHDVARTEHKVRLYCCRDAGSGTTCQDTVAAQVAFNGEGMQGGIRMASTGTIEETGSELPWSPIVRPSAPPTPPWLRGGPIMKVEN